MKKYLPALALLIFVSACSYEEPPPRVNYDPSLGPQIRLDIADLTIDDQSNPPDSNDLYYHFHFEPTIADALRQWANDHIQTVPTSNGHGTFVIKTVSLTSEPLELLDKDFIDDAFTRLQTTKYTAFVRVELRLQGHQNTPVVMARADQFRTLPKNPSDDERKQAYLSVLNSLLQQLGENLQTGVNQYMGEYIVGEAH